jgi:hypothetical protein
MKLSAAITTLPASRRPAADKTLAHCSRRLSWRRLNELLPTYTKTKLCHPTYTAANHLPSRTNKVIELWEQWQGNITSTLVNTEYVKHPERSTLPCSLAARLSKKKPAKY